MKRLLKMFGVMIVIIASNSNAQPGTPASAQSPNPRLERLQTHPVASDSVQKTAAKIKTDPRYNERLEGKSANWVARSFENLRKLLTRPATNRTPSQIAPPNLSILGWIIIGLGWTALAIAILAFLYFVVRFFQWRGKLAKRARAVLDEDEPDRTLDEWLALANDYEQRGMYREAVRCLYLASLMKFDEHHVAFFDRGQTNWEHLARIEASSRLPLGLQFRQPTQDFDQIWYGFRVNGTIDVAKFRAYYQDVVEQLRMGVAA